MMSTLFDAKTALMPVMVGEQQAPLKGYFSKGDE